MNENLNRIVNNKLFVFKILWLGIMTSVLVLTGVSYYLTALKQLPKPSLNESISTFFLLLAFVSFGISISLEKIWKIKPEDTFNRSKFIDSKKNLRTQHGQAIWSESEIQNLTTFTDTELQKLATLDKGYLRFLMGLTTAETCVLLGFINVYLSGQFTKIFPFVAMALVALLLKWPSETRLK